MNPGVYSNFITETEKQIVRDIFEVYAKETGVKFVEGLANGGLSIGNDGHSLIGRRGIARHGFERNGVRAWRQASHSVAGVAVTAAIHKPLCAGGNRARRGKIYRNRRIRFRDDGRGACCRSCPRSGQQRAGCGHNPPLSGQCGLSGAAGKRDCSIGPPAPRDDFGADLVGG